MSAKEPQPLPEGAERPTPPPAPPTLPSMEFRIARLNVRKGDVIVVKVDAHIPMDFAEKIKRTMEERYFPGHRCLVLEKGVEVSVMRPKNDEEGITG